MANHRSSYQEPRQVYDIHSSPSRTLQSVTILGRVPWSPHLVQHGLSELVGVGPLQQADGRHGQRQDAQQQSGQQRVQLGLLQHRVLVPAAGRGR